MARIESPFRQQPRPPSEPQLTGREGIRILMLELQGQTVNLRQVLESGVEADHAHLSSLAMRGVDGLNGTMLDTLSYKAHLLDKHGINGWVRLDGPNLRNDVTVVREGNYWPPDIVVKTFPWVDFRSPFRLKRFYFGISINTSRRGKDIDFFTVDVPLGYGIRRSEKNFIRVVEPTARMVELNGVDDLVVTDQGYELLTALLAARV